MKIRDVLDEVMVRCGLMSIAYSKAETYSIMQPAGPIMQNRQHGWLAVKMIDGKPCSRTFTMTEKQFPEKHQDLVEVLVNFFGAEDNVIPFKKGGTP